MYYNTPVWILKEKQYQALSDFLVEALTEEEKKILTDACKILVLKGEKVHLVQGEVSNIKITYPHDLRVAEAILGGEKTC